MARFGIGVPQTTEVPQVTVDPTLAVGIHRFRLVVVGAAGRQSAAADAVVEVRSLVVEPRLTPFGIGPGTNGSNR